MPSIQSCWACCQIFNDHKEILEVSLKENPTKFIQKALNHSAVDVKTFNDTIIEVRLCKEINDNLTELTELNDFKGYILG